MLPNLPPPHAAKATARAIIATPPAAIVSTPDYC
jgi:hypothetical protein